MRSKHYVVACLAGGGIGPELMAEASRAVAEVSRQHSFHVEELHVPFGGEAVARHGHPLPAATRAAYRRADAILVAATREPALDGVKADLDLTWRIMRVHSTPAGDLAVVSPLVDDAAAYAVERGFQLARARRAQGASVAESAVWRGGRPPAAGGPPPGARRGASPPRGAPPPRSWGPTLLRAPAPP